MTKDDIIFAVKLVVIHRQVKQLELFLQSGRPEPAKVVHGQWQTFLIY